MLWERPIAWVSISLEVFGAEGRLPGQDRGLRPRRAASPDGGAGRSGVEEMMRVTIVTETYFPQVNGVSRTLGELVRHLTERGDSVQVIHPDYGGAMGGLAPTHPVRSIVLPFYKELHLPLPPFGSAHRAIASFGPDVVHIATEATLGLSVLRFALRRRLNVVSSFHTNFDQYSGHYRVGWLRGLIWRYLRWFHNRGRETYVPSEATIRELDALGFERLVLWKRGVDATLFRPDRAGRMEVRRALGWAADEVVVGYVSRIAAEKNVDYLAEALAIVAARRPGTRFLFVGDGPSRARVEARIGSFTRFVGYRQGEDLADHYAACDLFAFASLTETFGNVVLEAMASGLPVVALRAGGVGETVQSGTTGLLVEPSEPPGCLAEALLPLIDHPDRRRQMAEAARRYALSQSWDAIMGGLRQRYQALSDRRPGAPVAGDSRR
jgi:glycosyltransferase involved in cell wall biosynthesis